MVGMDVVFIPFQLQPTHLSPAKPVQWWRRSGGQAQDRIDADFVVASVKSVGMGFFWWGIKLISRVLDVHNMFRRSHVPMTCAEPYSGAAGRSEQLTLQRTSIRMDLCDSDRRRAEGFCGYPLCFLRYQSRRNQRIVSNRSAMPDSDLAGTIYCVHV